MNPFLLLMCSSPVATAAAAFALYTALRNKEKISKKRMVMGACFLLLTCGWVIVFARSEFGILAFLGLVLSSLTALLAGILLALSLPGRRKVWGALICVAFPALLCLSLEIGTLFSPAAILHQNGRGIAQALDAYFADNGAFPATLDQLVPGYLTDLKEPETTGGWLYVSTGNDYTLGYVYHTSNEGSSVCVYGAKSPEWDCLQDSTGPFILGPTPTSTLAP